MLRTVLIVFLALGVIGTGFWGYKEHQEKNAILINAENNYQRAFHDLTYHMDLLHDKIGTTLAMNSRAQLSPALAEVWRLTSEAHADVGQLPLALLPFNKTEEFLSKIGEFSYRTAVRDLNKEPLSDEEYSTLKQLYKNSEDIQNELRKVQYLTMKNNLRWMDVELALASGEKRADNTIIDGFKTVEKNVESYSEVDFGPAFTQMEKRKEESLKNLKGKVITQKQAKQKALKFLGIEKADKIEVVESGDGSDYGFYSVAITQEKENARINMDITKKGGYPIWIIQDRDLGEQNISLNQAQEKALAFLKKHGFKNMEVAESVQYDNVGVFTFVKKEKDIRIYPESVRMKVSLDEGHVVGFSAKDYLMATHSREIKSPEADVNQALQKVNPQLKVMDNRLAIIINELGEEVLCYEILGTINNETYRIFINADNLHEEKVEKLGQKEVDYGSL